MQRVWKWQPEGGTIGLGTSPGNGRFTRLTLGFGIGTAVSSASVYGCSGLVNSAFLSAHSTILPRYMTATRWLMCSTTARQVVDPLQLHQQVDHLCLDRDIQRRHRLIGDDQAGI